jgi:hypothetical protein
MTNFETMKALRWKIDQVYSKSTPKTFMHSLKGGEVASTNNSINPSNPWTGDIILYILFLSTVVVCVCILIQYANDFKLS